MPVCHPQRVCEVVKACPGSSSIVSASGVPVVECSGHGTCARDAGCLAGVSSSCAAICSCDTGYSGFACSLTSSEVGVAVDRGRASAVSHLLDCVWTALALACRCRSLSQMTALQTARSQLLNATLSAWSESDSFDSSADQKAQAVAAAFGSGDEIFPSDRLQYLQLVREVSEHHAWHAPGFAGVSGTPLPPWHEPTGRVDLPECTPLPCSLATPRCHRRQCRPCCPSLRAC